MVSRFNTISRIAEAEHEIKKSRFIGVIMPCQSENDAMRKLRQLAGQHPHANHLAFAWRIHQMEGSVTERIHDAGEPSGTAGRPILAPLDGESLVNVVIGVVRYFGGIKLGTGGLTRAYGTAAKQAIAAATVIPWVEMTTLKIVIDYPQLQMLEYQLKQIHGQIIDQQFSEKVSLTLSIPASEKEAIKQQFSV